MTENIIDGSAHGPSADFRMLPAALSSFDSQSIRQFFPRRLLVFSLFRSIALEFSKELV
jgi:hypothetical protein